MEKLYYRRIFTTECDKCGKAFASSKMLIHHLRSSHRMKNPIPRSGFQCRCCGEFFPLKTNVMCHIAMSHPDEFSWCKNSESLGKYLEPVKVQNLDLWDPFIVETDIESQCVFCDEKFTPSGREEHYLTRHGDGEKFICKCCRKEFTGWSKIKEHIIRHEIFSNFHCFICKRGHKNAQDCRKHLRTNHLSEVLSWPLDHGKEDFTPFSSD